MSCEEKESGIREKLASFFGSSPSGTVSKIKNLGEKVSESAKDADRALNSEKSDEIRSGFEETFSLEGVKGLTEDESQVELDSEIEL